MSAPNFKFNCNSVFPMMVISNEDICRMYIEPEEGQEYFEPYEMDFAFDMYQSDIMQLEDELEELNEKLHWYKLSIESGYYDGMQILVDTDWLNIGEWSEEDCKDEFDLTKKETMLMMLEEQKTICEYLKTTSQYGLREIVCDGVFSNGEAIYHYVDKE